MFNAAAFMTGVKIRFGKLRMRTHLFPPASQSIDIER